MSKYTPGPWAARKAKDAIKPFIIDTDDYVICRIDRYDYNKEDGEMMEANARLIAAAPELVENLRRIIDRIEENGLQYAFPSAYERAKECIAKATGEKEEVI